MLNNFWSGTYYKRLVNFDLRVADIARQPEEHDSLATHSSNELTASTYGAEVIGKWQVTNFWQLTSSYSWFKLNAHLKTPHLTDIVFTQENSDPRHQFSVRSNIQLPYNLEFNSLFYYTDRLQAHNVQDQARLDLRLAWSPTSMLELSVVAQNITNKQHQEFTAQDIQQSYIPRSAYGRITFRF